MTCMRDPYPTPIEGRAGGGGQTQPFEFHFFFAWKPWDREQIPQKKI